MSAIKTEGLASSLGSRPRSDLRPMEPVRCIRLATCEAAHGSPMLPSHRSQDREMSIREVSSLGQHPTLPAGGEELAPSSIRANGPPEPPKPRLLDRVRQALRARHLGRRTEEAYVAWIRRLIFFHDKRHPAEMGAAEVTKFLTSLAVDGQVAASTPESGVERPPVPVQGRAGGGSPVARWHRARAAP
jgi:hypothetical protein